MKKILLFMCLAIAIVMVGCKKETDSTSENTDTFQNNSTDKAQGLVAQTPCIPSVVIDSSKMTKTEFSEWHAAYGNYVCTDLSSGNFYYTDISTFPDDSDNRKKAKWLEDYGKFVDFDRSEEYIIKTHTVNPTEITIISTKKLTVSKIKKLISETVLNDDKFNQYVKVEVGTEVRLTMVKDFEPNDNTFSVPFFRAIIKNLSNNSEIKFSNATINSTHLKTICVETPAMPGRRLDYTRWPLH